MKCYNCKKEIPNEVQFCPACSSPQQFSQELIEKVINKESAAEDQLYYMTYNNVFWEIKSMVKDEDLIHDLTQDTYIKAYNNLSQLKEAAAFRGWIKRIAHNLTIDYLRKTKPRVFSDMVSSESDEMLEFPDERTDSMPEAVMDQKETKRLIEEILNSLSDEQRVAVSMFYYQQKSIKEIAEELGISENTIKSRLFHGRNKVEYEVKELEKKGTKLYGLAPIPFLLFLFRTVEAQAAELPDTKILQTIKEQYHSGTAEPETNTYFGQSTNSSGIGKKAIKTVIKEASKEGIKIKLFTGIVAVLVIGGIVAGLTHNKNEDQVLSSNVLSESEYARSEPLEEVESPEEIRPLEKVEPPEEIEPPEELPWIDSTNPNYATEAEKFLGYYENSENDYRAIEIRIDEDGKLIAYYFTKGDLSTAIHDLRILNNQLGGGDYIPFALNEDGTLTVTDFQGLDVTSGNVTRDEHVLIYTKATPEAVARKLEAIRKGTSD